MRVGKPLDLVGQVFERLTVIARLPSSKLGSTMWLCRCTCGKERVVLGSNLTQGKTKSCGCFRDERLRQTNTRHGATWDGVHTPEYRAWAGLLWRCNPKSHSYTWSKHYVGRGITVCPRWRADFAAFLADMGPKPTAKHSIDRIDNDGNYEPGNCRWATHSQQMKNRRKYKITRKLS